jgi:hypothetical protein
MQKGHPVLASFRASNGQRSLGVVKQDDKQRGEWGPIQESHAPPDPDAIGTPGCSIECRCTEGRGSMQSRATEAVGAVMPSQGPFQCPGDSGPPANHLFYSNLIN